MCRNCIDRQVERRCDLKLRGICVNCMAQKASTGKTVCLDCAAKHLIAGRRSYAKAAALRPKRPAAPRTAGGTYVSTLVRRQTLKARGVCVCCGDHHQTRKDLCVRCNNVKKSRAERRYKSLREKGLCTLCHRRPAMAAKSHCDQCARLNQNKSMSLYKTRKRKRLCVSCGGGRDRRGFLMCSSCSKILSARWRRRQQRQRVSAARGGGSEATR